jgi:hypothetical protein
VAGDGHGAAIALTLALASAAIGVAVAIDWRHSVFLVLAAAVNLTYWVLGRGFGGVLTGSATEPNAGPLFILLALAIHRLPQTPLARPPALRESFARQRPSHR